MISLSETLAQAALVRQGELFQEAIKMYEKLMLDFSRKKCFLCGAN